MRKEQKKLQEGYPAKKSSSRFIALVVALLLTVGTVVSGTIAWLIAETEPVVNTFTYGDIDLTLTETDTNVDGDGNANTNSYIMIPGEELSKDPKITVAKDSEACWLFVKLVKDGGVEVFVDGSGTPVTYSFDEYLEYQVADGWTLLTGTNLQSTESVYFRKVDTNADEQNFGVIGYNKDNGDGTSTFVADTIKVKESVTKEMLNYLDNNGNTTYPTLTITAYAVQYSGFEAEISEGATEPTDVQRNAAALKAWEAVEEQNTPTTP